VLHEARCRNAIPRASGVRQWRGRFTKGRYNEGRACVLATVLGAVDLGYRIILVRDAVCSSSDEGHDALMTPYHQRYNEQIEMTDAATIIERWER
jgi:hypothetical protein